MAIRIRPALLPVCSVTSSEVSVWRNEAVTVV